MRQQKFSETELSEKQETPYTATLAATTAATTASTATTQPLTPLASIAASTREATTMSKKSHSASKPASDTSQLGSQDCIKSSINCQPLKQQQQQTGSEQASPTQTAAGKRKSAATQASAAAHQPAAQSAPGKWRSLEKRARMLDETGSAEPAQVGATVPQPAERSGTGSGANICAACLKPIKERYLLEALDKQWHEDCLKCACCDCRLGEVGSSLFTHSDKILCRRDFLRIFGQHGHCAACKKSIPPYELVMRANENAYHMDCFACQQCQYRFCVGDRFHLTASHRIVCILCHSDAQQQQQQQQHLLYKDPPPSSQQQQLLEQPAGSSSPPVHLLAACGGGSPEVGSRASQEEFQQRAPQESGTRSQQRACAT